MKKSDIIEFFDKRASVWDAEMIKDDSIIECIFDNAGIARGMDILDVACGTGVLIPYYLKRKVASVTAVDISPNMAAIAAKKFACDENVHVICADVEDQHFEQSFDCIMVYNAFPHFPHPEKLISTLSALLRPGGTLCIAHGASRETIDGHHKGPASKVSMGLMEAEKLKALFEEHLVISTVISDLRMYQVCGKKE